MSQKHGVLGNVKALEESLTNAITSKSKSRPELVRLYSDSSVKLEALSSSIPTGDKGFRLIKKELTVLSNVVAGVLDGLESQDLSLGELRALASDVHAEYLPSFLETVKAGTSVQEEVEVPEVKVSKTVRAAQRSLSQDRSFKEALKTALEALDSKNEQPVEEEHDTTDDATRAYLKQLPALRDRLPAGISRGGFTIIRMSVVPIFDAIAKTSGRTPGTGHQIQGQPNPANSLKQAGIRATPVMEYAVIDNQLLLAIDKGALPERPKPAGSRTRKVEKLSPYEFAQSILSTIHDTTDVSYSLVTDHLVSNPKNSDIVLFWIMETPLLTHLIQKRFPKVRSWGLPFQ